LRFPDQGLDLEPQISSSLRVELTVPSRRDLLELLADLCFRTLDNLSSRSSKSVPHSLVAPFYPRYPTP
jgi:hypothetical protein